MPNFKITQQNFFVVFMAQKFNVISIKLTLIQIQYKSRLAGKLKQRVKALIDRFFQFSNLYENDENFK